MDGRGSTASAFRGEPRGGFTGDGLRSSGEWHASGEKFMSMDPYLVVVAPLMVCAALDVIVGASDGA
ncbi:MAG: hypothetical protein ACOC98_16190, partial [Thermodesulfobacteriota bacterium]